MGLYIVEYVILRESRFSVGNPTQHPEMSYTLQRPGLGQVPSHPHIATSGTTMCRSSCLECATLKSMGVLVIYVPRSLEITVYDEFT